MGLTAIYQESLGYLLQALILFQFSLLLTEGFVRIRIRYLLLFAISFRTFSGKNVFTCEVSTAPA